MLAVIHAAREYAILEANVVIIPYVYRGPSTVLDIAIDKRQVPSTAFLVASNARTTTFLNVDAVELDVSVCPIELYHATVDKSLAVACARKTPARRKRVPITRDDGSLTRCVFDFVPGA
jgi:hypothetical protein